MSDFQQNNPSGEGEVISDVFRTSVTELGLTRLHRQFEEEEARYLEKLSDAFKAVSAIAKGLKHLQEEGATFEFNVAMGRRDDWFEIDTDIPLQAANGLRRGALTVSMTDRYAEVIGDDSGGNDDFVSANVLKEGGADEIIGFVEKYAKKRGMGPKS